MIFFTKINDSSVSILGFTPEVRIWEVCFDKAGQFKEIKSAFQLSHSAGVYNFSFNADSTK